MDASLKTNLDGNTTTTPAEPGTLIEGHDLETDRQIMTTDGQFEVVAMEEVMVSASGDLMVSDEQSTIATAAEEATMEAEVDPLALPESSFLSADETVPSPNSGTPGRPVSGASVTPRRIFLSPVESSPGISGRVRDMFAALGVDADTGVTTRGRRVAGRRQAVVEDDVETLSSMSATSAGEDSSMASSSRNKRKGVKRGREALKDKDYRKEGKAEGSNEENRRKGKGKKKEMERKETLEGVESDVVRGESKGMVKHILEDMPSPVLGGAIQEWASTIEDIRAKSKNLQGKLSGTIKECVAKIKEGTNILVVRSEATGDPQFLRMRNSELVAQLREAKRENARLQEQLRKESPGTSSPPRKKKVVRTVALDAAQGDPDDPMDPSTREEFPPLPQRLPRGREAQDGGKKKAGPRIVSNVQVAPPFKERRNEKVAAPVVSGSEAEWKVVLGSRRRGRVEGDRSPPPPPPHPPTSDVGRPPVRQQQQPKVRLPRPPVSSAVTITGRAEGFSYAEAMKSAREHINLEKLGITTSRVRKALNGGLLIEVSGEDSRTKAEELVTRLRSVLKDSAAVTCPVKKRELTVVGFDESVTTGEIVEALCNIGGCPKADIKIGPIRTMNNGLGMVWVQLPVAAAAKAAEEGRVRVGWTMARVDLLKVRPLQCFKCWSFGHVQNACRSVVDRSGACFRCGQKGHVASTCRNVVHCVVCHDAGLEATHRLGGPECVAQERQGGK